MANPVVGHTTCRCGAEAEVRQGEKGKLYEHCEECVGIYRTMSAAGQRGIRARMRPIDGGRVPSPEPAKVEEVKAEVVPEKKPAPVKKVNTLWGIPL